MYWYAINHLLSWLSDWLIALSRVLWRLGTSPTGKMCEDVGGGYNYLWSCFILYCIACLLFDLNNYNYIVFVFNLYYYYIFMCIGCLFFGWFSLVGWMAVFGSVGWLVGWFALVGCLVRIEWFSLVGFLW